MQYIDDAEFQVAIDLDAYTKMEEADAQGYLTFDAYRTLRYLENNWSDKQEALFQDVINGKTLKFEGGVYLRNYIHVKCAAFIIKKIVESRDVGIYYAASTRAISIS